MQQNHTREQGYFRTETPLRESTVSLDLCGDSKLALSSDRRVKESVKPIPNLGSNRRLSKELDTRIEELNHPFSSRLRSTTKQEESFSERKHFRREKPATRDPRLQLSSNTRSEELSTYPSPSLDHIWADNDTSEVDLGFTSINNGPKRSSKRPETEIAIRQYKRHQRNRRDTCALESDQLCSQKRLDKSNVSQSKIHQKKSNRRASQKPRNQRYVL